MSCKRNIQAGRYAAHLISAS
ncbi:hypothetical protein DXA13_02980 [Clostridium sp. AM58-1XD]|nr:hypothetical protein DXA13_02980 [Clostridium sp. AM58-1XD]